MHVPVQLLTKSRGLAVRHRSLRNSEFLRELATSDAMGIAANIHRYQPNANRKAYKAIALAWCAGGVTILLLVESSTNH